MRPAFLPQGILTVGPHLQTVSGETEEAKGGLPPIPAQLPPSPSPSLEIRVLQLASSTANVVLSLGRSGTVVQAVHTTSAGVLTTQWIAYIDYDTSWQMAVRVF